MVICGVAAAFVSPSERNGLLSASQGGAKRFPVLTYDLVGARHASPLRCGACGAVHLTHSVATYKVPAAR
jgi:hypothetical protein